jgi:hypothetical protein
VGEGRRTLDRTDELISELRDRVRSLENQLRQERAANRENRRIIASLTSRTPERPAAPVARRIEPARRRIRSWWKGQFGAAMVGVVTAFAVLTANGEENPLRLAKPGGEEQARVPTTTQPAPSEAGPVGREPVSTQPPPPPEPAPGPVMTEPVPTEPVR